LKFDPESRRTQKILIKQGLGEGQKRISRLHRYDSEFRYASFNRFASLTENRKHKNKFGGRSPTREALTNTF
ncbi:hypothetical protein D0649_23150, partial [Salmonella enterica]|nr:hypothetical protein [Salmonella enterica]